MPRSIFIYHTDAYEHTPDKFYGCNMRIPRFIPQLGLVGLGGGGGVRVWHNRDSMLSCVHILRAQPGTQRSAYADF